MKVKETMFSNIQIVLDEFDIAVAVRVDGKDKYHLYDMVKVTGDCRGYIAPGIRHEGAGRIVEIRDNDVDHFYGVLMNETHEFGFVKAARIKLAWSNVMI